MKSFVLLRSVVCILRSLLLCALLAPVFAACEKKPTAEELEVARNLTPAPATPKAGDWMYDKDRKTKLDEKAKKN